MGWRRRKEPPDTSMIALPRSELICDLRKRLNDLRDDEEDRPRPLSTTISREQLAARLGITPRWLKRLVRSGELPDTDVRAVERAWLELPVDRRQTLQRQAETETEDDDPKKPEKGHVSKGITFFPGRGSYKVQRNIKGKVRYLGTFYSLEEVSAAFEAAKSKASAK